ncbi:MAG: hypothetical protein V4456_12525 [Bacteroidota bacterium]
MANLNSASVAARANALSQLDSLGSNRSEFTTEAVFSALEKDANAFIDRIHENINSAGIANTGGISDIRMMVSDAGIDIVGKPYLIYQDKGVSGTERTRPDTPFKYSDKKPPANSFRDLILKKNLLLRNEEFYDHNAGSPHSDIDGDEAAIKSLSYAMRESIFKEGFPAKNLFSKEVPKLVADVTKSVSDFTADFITSSIRDRYGNNIGKVGLKK